MLIVETAHSRYEIDEEAHTYKRTTVHADANQLPGRSAGEANHYTDVVLPGVGSRMLIFHGDGKVLFSTPVKSIEHKLDDQPVLPFTYDKEAKAA